MIDIQNIFKKSIFRSGITISVLLSLLFFTFDFLLGVYYCFPYNIPTAKILLVFLTGIFLYFLSSIIIVFFCYIAIKCLNANKVNNENVELLSFLISSTFFSIIAFYYLQQPGSPVGISGFKLLIFFILLFFSGLSVQYIYHSKKNLIKKISKTFIIMPAFLFVSVFTLILLLLYSNSKLISSNFLKEDLIIISGVWGLFYLFVVSFHFSKGKLKIIFPNKLKLLLIMSTFILLSSLSVFYVSKSAIQVKSRSGGYNFLLVVLDTLRADGVGVYGSNLETPAIDKVAKKGILFENAYSQAPWTLPSMTSFFASRYPSELELSSEKKEKWKIYKIPESVNTFAEALQKKKYATKAIIGNYLLNPSSGILQGFSSYNIINHRRKIRNKFSQILPLLESIIVYYFPKPEYMYLSNTCETLTNYAITFINQNYNNNFFLWLHYIDPHDPYNPPYKYRKTKFDDAPFPVFAPDDAKSYKSPSTKDIRAGDVLLTDYDKKYIRELYNGEIEYVSDLFGRIINQLEEKKILDNTVICVTADHGEEFWEHGDFSHGTSLYSELLKVPLVVYIPKFNGKKIIKEPVSLIDIMPTFFDIAGIPIPSNYKGNSLLPNLSKNSNFREKSIYFEGATLFDRKKAIANSNYKLIVNIDSGFKELYNIISDPYEINNIANSNSEQVELMNQQLKSWMLSNENTLQSENKNNYQKEKKEQMERLKGLGYIQ